MPVRQMQPERARTGRLQRKLARYLPLLALGGALASGACSLKPASDGTRDHGPLSSAFFKLMSKGNKRHQEQKTPSSQALAAERPAGGQMEKCKKGSSGSTDICSLENPDFLKHFSRIRMDGAPMNSLETISRLPYADMVRFLGLKSGDTVDITYPAAGTHIAVLQFGLMLQRIADVRVSYTFTELKAHAEEFAEEFAKLLIAPYIVQKDFHKSDGGAVFELEVFGKPATVRYVFVEKNDALPLHVPHGIALKTDIFFMHDSMDGCYPREYCDLEAFAFGGIYAAASGKPKVVINEDVAHALAGRHPMSVYDIFPGDGQGIQGVPGDYGCPDFSTGGALVYFPDAAAYMRMMASPASLRMFNNALDLLAFNSNGHLGGWSDTRETYSGKAYRHGPVHVSHFETAVNEIREKYSR